MMLMGSTAAGLPSILSVGLIEIDDVGSASGAALLLGVCVVARSSSARLCVLMKVVMFVLAEAKAFMVSVGYAGMLRSWRPVHSSSSSSSSSSECGVQVMNIKGIAGVKVNGSAGQSAAESMRNTSHQCT
jgi:hypothetical protein